MVKYRITKLVGYQSGEYRITQGYQHCLCKLGWPNNREQRHAFRDSIMEFCEKHETTKFIVDLRKQTTGTDIKDHYEFGKQLRRKMNGYTIAAIYRKGGLTENLLTETVQRGNVNLKVFYNLPEAKKWISTQ